MASDPKADTLAYHRRMSAAIFGEDSPATKFLDEKIAKQGPDARVVAPEGFVVQLLGQLHFSAIDNAAADALDLTGDDGE